MCGGEGGVGFGLCSQSPDHYLNYLTLPGIVNDILLQWTVISACNNTSVPCFYSSTVSFIPSIKKLAILNPALLFIRKCFF